MCLGASQREQDLCRGSLRCGIGSLQEILHFRAGLGLSTGDTIASRVLGNDARTGAAGNVRAWHLTGLLMDECGQMFLLPGFLHLI